MELESIKELVIQASTTFYSTQDKEQRRSAEEWLNEFKKSVHAWFVTDQILHTNTNEQVLFFAAQTIRSKIQHSFHELPTNSHEVSFHRLAISAPSYPSSLSIFFVVAVKHFSFRLNLFVIYFSIFLRSKT